jgi:hypothetical protein
MGNTSIFLLKNIIRHLIELLHPDTLTSIIDNRAEAIKNEIIERIKYEHKLEIQKQDKFLIDGKTYYNSYTEDRDYYSQNYYEYLYHLRTKDGLSLVELDGEKLYKYSSGHFAHYGNNLLGHYRCTYMEDAYSGVHCFIEEIQSDWTQDLRYRDSSPFASNSDFIEFITKVIIVNAVKYGAETIMFTSGEMQKQEMAQRVFAVKTYTMGEKRNIHLFS